MAYVKLKFTNSHGDKLAATLDIESSYPDAIAESRTQAVAMMKDAAALFFATTDDD